MRGYQGGDMVWIVDIANGRKVPHDGSYLVGGWWSLLDDLWVEPEWGFGHAPRWIRRKECGLRHDKCPNGGR